MGSLGPRVAIVAALGCGSSPEPIDTASQTVTDEPSGPYAFDKGALDPAFVQRNAVWAGVALLDFDDDGWLDIFFTNGLGGADALYQNQGDGTFTDSMVEDPMAVLVTTEDAAAVLRQALVAIEEVDDPRQAIRLAYSLVEAGFGDLDARRGPSESESEYLSRLLPGLGASADSMRRLTDLFEQARFSAHSITEDMRADAVGSLAALRDELTVVVSQRAAPDAEGDNA